VYLNLEGCKQVLDDVLEAVRVERPGLQTLRLTWCNHASDSAIAKLAHTCPGIEVVDYYGNSHYGRDRAGDEDDMF